MIVVKKEEDGEDLQNAPNQIKLEKNKIILI